MDVVFVVGLSIEIAGAALLAAGQIRLVDRTLIPLRNSRESGEPRRAPQLESARFTVGVALLATGVIVQLFGYAVHGGWWLLGLAVGVILLAALVGRPELGATLACPAGVGLPAELTLVEVRC